MYSTKNMFIKILYYILIFIVVNICFVTLIFKNDANVLNVTVYNDFNESCVIFICFSIMSLHAKSVEISSVLKDMCLPFGPQKCMYTYPLNLLTTKLLYSDTASFESPFLSDSNCFGAALFKVVIRFAGLLPSLAVAKLNVFAGVAGEFLEALLGSMVLLLVVFVMLDCKTVHSFHMFYKYHHSCIHRHPCLYASVLYTVVYLNTLFGLSHSNFYSQVYDVMIGINSHHLVAWHHSK